MVKSTTEAAPVGDIEASNAKMEEPVSKTEPSKVEEAVSANGAKDAEEGQLSNAKEGTAAINDSPQEQAVATEISIEQGVPPETPVRDSKKLDPSSPSRDTELGDSFESIEPDIGGDDTASEKPNRRRNHFIFGTIILVLFLGAVLGIIFGIGVAGPRSVESNAVSASQSGGSQGESQPTVSPGVDAPAPAPTDKGIDTPAPAPTDKETTQTTPPTDATAQDDPLLDVLKGFSPSGALDDATSPQYEAYQWLLNEDPLTDADTDPARLQQRYSLVTLYAALGGEIPSDATQDECEWTTVACGTHNATNLFGTKDWQVTEINMARNGFGGTVPPEIGLLAPSLVLLDLAENEIKGSLPDEFFELSNLQYLYLHDNSMTGTLSEDIGNLQLLDHLYLGNNQFGGTIPYNIGSRTATHRPLRKLTFLWIAFYTLGALLNRAHAHFSWNFTGFLILHNNQFEGPIPTNMSLTSLFHMDLSFNNLNGTLPADIGENFYKLKQLYLDHNQFTGSIPSTYPMAGNGRLYVLMLNDNMLTGGVPTGWVKDNLFVDTINVQHNNLTESIDKEICKFSALENGELVQVGAECAICTCDVLCDNCY